MHKLWLSAPVLPNLCVVHVCVLFLRGGGDVAKGLLSLSSVTSHMARAHEELPGWFNQGIVG